MFLEYEHKITNITKAKDEELRNVKVSKKKIEEDYRNAIKEKQLLKDTERILLNTFDTLKQYYDSKESEDPTDSRRNNRNVTNDSERTQRRPGKTYECNKCRFTANNEASLRTHIDTSHEQQHKQKRAQYGDRRI